MEYQRRTREERQLSNAGGTPSGVSLTGPVGLRWGKNNVTNSNEDQRKIIDLLAAIPAKDGGRKEEWSANYPLAGPSGQCPRILVHAIWEFQRWWQALGVFRQIDNVVDPGGNTLKQLNKLANQNGGSGSLRPKPKPAPPEPQVLDDWFVTEFGGYAESVVITLGYSAMQGNVAFTRADGTKYRGAIGMFGLSAGVSLDVGKMPGVKQVLRRFPALSQFLGNPSGPGVNNLLKWVSTQGILQRIIAITPGGMRLYTQLAQVILGGSVAPDWMPSTAIGMVFPFKPPLSTTSFYGSCICYALTGTATIANAGTYILFFGYRGDMFSASFSPDNFTGCAIVSAAGAQLQVPGLGVAGTVFVGEIV